MTDSVERKNVIELLRLYHSLPALWDVSCEDYSNRSIKEQQYDILLQKYKRTNPHAEKKELTKKINTLRTNYRREVKRIREAEQNGGPSDSIVPTLYYFDALNFLSEVETPANSSKVKFKVSPYDHSIQNDSILYGQRITVSNKSVYIELDIMSILYEFF